MSRLRDRRPALHTDKVTCTSSDSIARIGSNYKFGAADYGQSAFASLKTLGDQSITASDVNDATITASHRHHRHGPARR
jgi:hypothetical protein